MPHHKLPHAFKSGINFQAALRRNHTQTNCVKRDPPVLYGLQCQE